MACETWTERLVERACGEIDPRADAALDAHLAACAACRDALVDLDAAREALRDGAAEIPEPRTVIVLGSRPRGRNVATVVLSAAAALAAGVVLGVLLDRRGAASRVDAADLRRALDDHAVRVERLVDERVAAATSEGGLTREDLDATVAALRAAIEDGRRRDVESLLAEIAALEMRSTDASDDTRQTLRYYALASDPAATEW